MWKYVHAVVAWSKVLPLGMVKALGREQVNHMEPSVEGQVQASSRRVTMASASRSF